MANPRPDPTPMQLDIAARILISRANGCGDLRGRFGPISELVFERLVEDARIALWDRPAKQAGGGETSESGLLVGPEPGRARLSAQSILDVYLEFGPTSIGCVTVACTTPSASKIIAGNINGLNGGAVSRTPTFLSLTKRQLRGPEPKVLSDRPWARTVEGLADENLADLVQVVGRQI